MFRGGSDCLESRERQIESITFPAGAAHSRSGGDQSGWMVEQGTMISALAWVSRSR